MSNLADKLAAARAKVPTAPTVEHAPVVPVAPTAPAVTFMMPKRTQADMAVDALIDSIDIITAYNRYAHKGTVEAGGKTEGIMCSCPNPAHPDRNPSAWINTDKQTWFCAGCNEGGDKLDIAAWHFGLPVPGYKEGRHFHDLRKRIAEDHGYSFQRVVGGVTVVNPPAGSPAGADGRDSAGRNRGGGESGEVGNSGAESEGRGNGPDQIGGQTGVPVRHGNFFSDNLGHDEENGTPVRGSGSGVPEIATPAPAGLGIVIGGDATPAGTGAPARDSISALEEVEDIELDWRSVVPSGTFLDIWMQQTIIDDVPEEYHFWNGMLAISMAIGRDVTLQDFRPVYGNLFICILGRSGSGKSKAKYYLDKLLEQAMPYKHSDPKSKGVQRFQSPASAEALIWLFKKEIQDPLAPVGTPPRLYPVKGIIDYNELAQMVGRGQRAGNVLMPTMMQFFDCESTVETASRTHGVEKAVEPYACAITTSQPKSLRNLVGQAEAASGFLNRWFFAGGKEKKRAAVGGVVVDINPAIKPLQDILGWAGAGASVAWSQEAEDKFTTFFHDILHPAQRADETELLNRLDLLCKKLILLFTANMKLDTVPVQAVEQMMKMYPYLLECYGVPGAQVGNTLQHEVRESILKIVIDHQLRMGRGATNRDITRRLARRKYPLDIYNRTMKYMVEIEELIVQPESSPTGRTTVRYMVSNPDDWDFTPKKSSAKSKDAM